MRILLLDNYDSFTYNLVHLLRELDLCKWEVYRNDKLHLEDVSQYDKIVPLPGPGIPEEAGMLKSIIQNYAESTPILGVCLGHQAIAEVFGGELINLPLVYHGVPSQVLVQNQKSVLFKKHAGQVSGRALSFVVCEKTKFTRQLRNYCYR